MSHAVGMFSCVACGKQYAWKPQLAGKSARCKCGAKIDVPASMPGTDDDEMQDFGLAEPAPALQPMAAVARPVPLAKPIDYHNAKPQREADKRVRQALSDPGKDLYRPLALLVAGIVLLIAYVLVHSDGSAAAVVGTMIIVLPLTLIKTAALIGVAFFAAAIFGAYFGTIGTAILKFASIVVFTSALFSWLSMGMIGGGFYGFIFVGSLQALVIGGLCWFVFEFDASDIFKMGLLLGVAMRVIDIAALLTLRAIFDV